MGGPDLKSQRLVFVCQATAFPRVPCPFLGPARSGAITLEETRVPLLDLLLGHCVESLVSWSHFLLVLLAAALPPFFRPVRSPVSRGFSDRRVSVAVCPGFELPLFFLSGSAPFPPFPARPPNSLSPEVSGRSDQVTVLDLTSRLPRPFFLCGFERSRLSFFFFLAFSPQPAFFSCMPCLFPRRDGFFSLLHNRFLNGVLKF